MQVFVLCTGRCGSVTFAKACGHITNYTAGHESNWSAIGPARLTYPDNHIEVDNRLAWFLGRLEAAYGNEVRYVHLLRDPDDTAASLNRTWDRGAAIMPAYRERLTHATKERGIDVCRDYVETVTTNIRSFLRDKTHVMEFRLESAHDDFSRFWSWIKAEGDFEAALAEWGKHYNSTEDRERKRHRKKRPFPIKWRDSIVKRLPHFISN
jgi:hypothetical protein